MSEIYHVAEQSSQNCSRFTKVTNIIFFRPQCVYCHFFCRPPTLLFICSWQIGCLTTLQEDETLEKHQFYGIILIQSGHGQAWQVVVYKVYFNYIAPTNRQNRQTEVTTSVKVVKTFSKSSPVTFLKQPVCVHRYIYYCYYYIYESTQNYRLYTVLKSVLNDQPSASTPFNVGK